MIRPVRRRAVFDEFRRVRPGRCGPVRVRVLAGRADSADDVLVAYALGRRTGGAVVRNRIRRRLRAVLGEMHRRGDARLEAGAAYLVTADAEAATAPYADLCRWTEAALVKASRPS